MFLHGVRCVMCVCVLVAHFYDGFNLYDDANDLLFFLIIVLPDLFSSCRNLLFRILLSMN